MHLIAEWWAAMYGNVFAISIWTVILFIWQHYKLKAHASRLHEELKEHVTDLHYKWAHHVVRQVNGNPPEEPVSSGKEVS